MNGTAIRLAAKKYRFAALGMSFPIPAKRRIYGVRAVYPTKTLPH